MIFCQRHPVAHYRAVALQVLTQVSGETEAFAIILAVTAQRAKGAAVDLGLPPKLRNVRLIMRSPKDLPDCILKPVLSVFGCSAGFEAGENFKNFVIGDLHFFAFLVLGLPRGLSRYPTMENHRLEASKVCLRTGGTFQKSL